MELMVFAVKGSPIGLNSSSIISSQLDSAFGLRFWGESLGWFNGFDIGPNNNRPGHRGNMDDWSKHSIGHWCSLVARFSAVTMSGAKGP